jgi:hypothetical protein
MDTGSEKYVYASYNHAKKNGCLYGTHTTFKKAIVKRTTFRRRVNLFALITDDTLFNETAFMAN